MQQRTLFWLSGLAQMITLPLQILGFVLHPASEQGVDYARANLRARAPHAVRSVDIRPARTSGIYALGAPLPRCQRGKVVPGEGARLLRGLQACHAEGLPEAHRPRARYPSPYRGGRPKPLYRESRGSPIASGPNNPRSRGAIGIDKRQPISSLWLEWLSS